MTIPLKYGGGRYFKCPYQAKVIKIFEMVSRIIVVMLAMLPRIHGRRERDSMAHFTSIVNSAVFLFPLPSSAVKTYFVVFLGLIWKQRFTDGQTLPTGGSMLTDFAFEAP